MCSAFFPLFLTKYLTRIESLLNFKSIKWLGEVMHTTTLVGWYRFGFIYRIPEQFWQVHQPKYASELSSIISISILVHLTWYKTPQVSQETEFSVKPTCSLQTAQARNLLEDLWGGGNSIWTPYSRLMRRVNSNKVFCNY